MMTDHDQTDKTGKADSGSLRRLAEHVETTFNEAELSLTDDHTVAAFSVTLTLVRGMLEGAQAQGIVDEEQRAELDALFAGVAEIPRLIS
jgi:uncharacterized membrane protein YebE (DUF533 family)